MVVLLTYEVLKCIICFWEDGGGGGLVQSLDSHFIELPVTLIILYDKTFSLNHKVVGSLL